MVATSLSLCARLRTASTSDSGESGLTVIVLDLCSVLKGDQDSGLLWPE